MVAVSLLLGACGTKVTLEAEGPPAIPDTDAAPASSPSADSEPTAGDEESTPSLPERDADDDAPDALAAAIHPLYVSLSVHVEGWSDEADNVAGFERHRDALLDLARSAADQGVAISFELGPVFVAAVNNHGDPVVDQLIDLGHGIGVHADIGGRRTLPLPVFETELTKQRESVEALAGAPVTHVSGICSKGPWIEAAARSGLVSVNGAVAYCMISLSEENMPAGAEFVSDCKGPGDCHGDMTVTDDQRRYPFRVDSSEDFLSDPAAGSERNSVVLMIGESASSIDCLSESDPSGGCAADLDDIVLASETLERYIADHDPSRVASLSWSWSIGSAPPAGWSDALFAAFADRAADGSIAWASTDTVGRIADEALPKG